jgi:hypothetical protein
MKQIVNAPHGLGGNVEHAFDPWQIVGRPRCSNHQRKCHVPLDRRRRLDRDRPRL